MRLIQNLISADRPAYRVAIHHDAEVAEYRVRVYKDGIAYSPADYYTNDFRDATGTAKHMLETAVVPDERPALYLLG